MSNDFLFSLIVILVLGCLGAYLGIKHRKWLSWPTLENYLSSYPTAHVNQEIRCCNCGSNHIRQYGWATKNDARRTHQCNKCNSGLYRTGDANFLIVLVLGALALAFWLASGGRNGRS
jgi:hypothetical protein